VNRVNFYTALFWIFFSAGLLAFAGAVWLALKHW
jgi:hypothetical protein